MPHLRTSAGKHKVRIRWAGPLDKAVLLEELHRFRQDLSAGAES
jgi:hypothetical protein